MGLVQLFVILGIIAGVILLLCIALAKQYRKVGPNEVLIISGGRRRTITEPDGSRNNFATSGQTSRYVSTNTRMSPFHCLPAKRHFVDWWRETTASDVSWAVRRVR